MRLGGLTRTIVLALLLASCAADGGGGGGSTDAGSGNELIVGSFDFTESRVLAQLYAQTLSAGGYEARALKTGASREILEPALEQGRVDLVPEYQGTALLFLIGDDAFSAEGLKAVDGALTKASNERGLRVLDYSPAENKNELVVTKAFADRFGVSSITDLASVRHDLVFGGPPECPTRPLCIPGFERVYGLTFGTFVPLDVGGPLTLAALESGEIEVGLLFTTDAALAGNRFVVLADDLGLQPPEHIVPLAREDATARFGSGFVDTVDDLTSRLTTPALRDLNEQVDRLGESPAQVAANWLESEGLVDE